MSVSRRPVTLGVIGSMIKKYLRKYVGIVGDSPTREVINIRRNEPGYAGSEVDGWYPCVGIGTKEPEAKLHIASSINAKAKLLMTNYAGSSFITFQRANGGGPSDTGAPDFDLATPTIIADDDQIGCITFAGYDGTDFNSGVALIRCQVDGTPGANDTPGRLSFSVTADGSSSSTERFRISENGDLTATDTSIGSLSDRRLKENIEDWGGGLEIIKNLKPKTFNFINQEYHRRGTTRGFVAQDILEVDEYWIREQKVLEVDRPLDFELLQDTGGKAYIATLGEKDTMYVSAIQELNQKIEQLEAEVERLKDG